MTLVTDIAIPWFLTEEIIFLAAYYHSNNSGTCLNSCKIVKIPLELIDEQFGLKQ